MNDETHEHLWESCDCRADECHVEVCVICEAMRSTVSGSIYYAELDD